MARGRLNGSCWTNSDTDLVEMVAEQILHQETWLIAARAGKYACPKTIWVDGPEPASEENRAPAASDFPPVITEECP